LCAIFNIKCGELIACAHEILFFDGRRKMRFNMEVFLSDSQSLSFFIPTALEELFAAMRIHPT
jgi:hypothetical protein